MATRLITLPLIEYRPPGKDRQTGEPFPATYEVDTLGFEVDGTEIKSNYRDVGKVLVTCKTDKQCSDLAAKSKDHFKALGWA